MYIARSQVLNYFRISRERASELICTADLSDENWVDVDENREPMENISACIGRWRNAGPEPRKKMFDSFAATGISVVICRHGHFLFF